MRHDDHMTYADYERRTFSERILRLPEDESVQIRRLLSTAQPEDIVLMQCFNKEDVERIKASLTDEERARVRFTWMVFK